MSAVTFASKREVATVTVGQHNRTLPLWPWAQQKTWVQCYSFPYQKEGLCNGISVQCILIMLIYCHKFSALHWTIGTRVCIVYQIIHIQLQLCHRSQENRFKWGEEFSWFDRVKVDCFPWGWKFTRHLDEKDSWHFNLCSLQYITSFSKHYCKSIHFRRSVTVPTLRITKKCSELFWYDFKIHLGKGMKKSF